MLVLKLRKSDRIHIGDDLVLEIKEAGAGRVRIALGAPQDVAIRNEKVGVNAHDMFDEGGAITVQPID